MDSKDDNMVLQGVNWIGKAASAEGATTFTGFSTLTGNALETAFHPATESEIDRAVTAAESASAAYRAVPAERRADFLERIAEELLALGDALLQQAHQETALPLARLTGERQRTVGQLRLFAGLVREGSWVDARIDRALPDRQPAPRPDLRRMLIPLGPVGVFGASNFPFAFSVAGGDTASALAAGCPVVVKAHPAHPGTSELAARAILAAVEVTGMPDGTFSMIHGGAEVGAALVRHPALKAVGFTGSLRAGRALFDIAAARPEPIPVYAEMGSVNPVFVLPNAVKERGAALADGLAQSVTLGVGQFCTNPGLVIGLKGEALDAFTAAASDAVANRVLAPMLTPGIQKAYKAGCERLDKITDVHRKTPLAAISDRVPTAAVFTTDAKTVLREHSVAEEVFGPTTVIIACDNAEEMLAVARHLEGQLTVTLHGTPEDLLESRTLITVLETKAGRIVFNGFPTGVEVSPAMEHGGPYPATSDSRSTSVGTAAIFRFARPVCWQDAHPDLLPPELQNANPRQIRRLVDGVSTQESIA